MNESVNDQELVTVKKIIESIVEKLEVSAELEVSRADDVVDVVLKTPESGMLIGYHGEILESLQLVFSMAASKALGRFVRVVVDVGDYRKNRTEYLQRLAQQVKDRVISEGKEQVLGDLKSWERRVVHMILKEDPDVITESDGRGRDRVLVVRPK